MKEKLEYEVFCGNEDCSAPKQSDTQGIIYHFPEGEIEGQVNCSYCGYLLNLDGPSFYPDNVFALALSDFNWDEFLEIERGDYEDRAYDAMIDRRYES